MLSKINEERKRKRKSEKEGGGREEGRHVYPDELP